jgi:O-acetyl-ADP-ribose deacetylase (regulator of RNase III)
MIKIIQGDITKVKVDVIVNAANTSLLGGGGVDGAIHRAGGYEILEQCKIIVSNQGGCDVGKAVITTAGKLPSKFVIHTVGPVWKGGNENEDKLLFDAYFNSLLLANANQSQSIAFPNISTGVYHFPKERAAKIALNAINEFFKNSSTITEIFIVCFDDENY